MLRNFLERGCKTEFEVEIAICLQFMVLFVCEEFEFEFFKSNFKKRY